jgi:hypothetical protein
MTTIREVQQAVDRALKSEGFYDPWRPDGIRYMTIDTALPKAEAALDLKLTVEEDFGTYGMVLSAAGVEGRVEIHASRKVQAGGITVPNPDFGTVWTR